MYHAHDNELWMHLNFLQEPSESFRLDRSAFTGETVIITISIERHYLFDELSSRSLHPGISAFQEKTFGSGIAPHSSPMTMHPIYRQSSSATEDEADMETDGNDSRLKAYSAEHASTVGPKNLSQSEPASMCCARVGREL